jgi:pimeloyl-ACP methyl ester carboxylesterase
MPEITLPNGARISLRESGPSDGPSVVFVHGILVDGRLWDDVAAPLAAAGARVIQPDWPLGAHRTPMPRDADLTPPGLAKLVADTLAALDLEDVTLVANDTGGAISQLVVTRHPERIGRLVLTSCDAFDNFLPKDFVPLKLAGGYVPGFLKLAGMSLRSHALQRSRLGFGLVVKRHRTDLYDAWMEAGRSSAGVRRDAAKVLRGISSRYTKDAAEKLPGFTKPALIAWAREDKIFPVAHGQRLADLLPDSRLELIDDAYSFVPLDRPAEVAELTAEFLGLRLASGAGRGGSSTSPPPPANSSSAAPAVSK